jgi:hypothetical protein
MFCAIDKMPSKIILWDENIKKGGWSAALMHFYLINIFSLASVRSVAKDF